MAKFLEIFHTVGGGGGSPGGVEKIRTFFLEGFPYALQLSQPIDFIGLLPTAGG